MWNVVFGTGPSDVWLAGGNYAIGSLLHFDGMSWTKVPSVYPAFNSALWSSGAEGWLFDVTGQGWHGSGASTHHLNLCSTHHQAQ